MFVMGVKWKYDIQCVMYLLCLKQVFEICRKVQFKREEKIFGNYLVYFLFFIWEEKEIMEGEFFEERRRDGFRISLLFFLLYCDRVVKSIINYRNWFIYSCFISNRFSFFNLVTLFFLISMLYGGFFRDGGSVFLGRGFRGGRVFFSFFKVWLRLFC